MKASEIFESTDYVPWGLRETLPPSMTVPDMDPYYEYYRFLVAIAGYPTNELPTEAMTRDVPFIVPYTPIEHKWTTDILKKLGKAPRHLTKKSSTEQLSVNTKSPIRPFKDYDR